MTVCSTVSHVPPQPPLAPTLPHPDVPHVLQPADPQDEPQLDTPQLPQSLTVPHPPQLDAQLLVATLQEGTTQHWRTLQRDLRPASTSSLHIVTAKAQVIENNTNLIF